MVRAPYFKSMTSAENTLSEMGGDAKRMRNNNALTFRRRCLKIKGDKFKCRDKSDLPGRVACLDCPPRYRSMVILGRSSLRAQARGRQLVISRKSFAPFVRSPHWLRVATESRHLIIASKCQSRQVAGRGGQCLIGIISYKYPLEGCHADRPP